jgi:hypothetical protein
LSLAPHSGRIEGLAFGAESLLASAYSTSIKLSNATTGEAAGPNKAFSQDGFFLADEDARFSIAAIITV